jgi:hypothetical protein
MMGLMLLIRRGKDFSFFSLSCEYIAAVHILEAVGALTLVLRFE